MALELVPSLKGRLSVSVAEAADILSISESQCRELANCNQLRKVGIGTGKLRSAANICTVSLIEFWSRGGAPEPSGHAPRATRTPARAGAGGDRVASRFL